jgi:hypothetical protein
MTTMSLCAGCGRIGFDGIGFDGIGTRDGDPGDAVRDADEPCGPMGTVKYEYLFAGPRAGVYDANRIAVTPAGVKVSVTTLSGPELHHFDHALVETAAATPLMTAGNHGIAYDEVNQRLHAYQVSSGNSVIISYTLDGMTVVAGPTTTGVDTGGGFVDSAGHLHLVQRIGKGTREYTADHAFVRTWATDAPAAGTDLGFDPIRQEAWVTAQLGIARYAYGATPTLQLTTALPGNLIPEAVAVDSNGTAYIGRRAEGQVYVFRDANLVGMLDYTGQDPVTLEYDPYSKLLLIGFYEPMVTRLRAMCPYEP